MLYNLSFKHNVPEDTIVIDVTSRSSNWGKNFSPFNLGPVDLYDDYWSYNVENAYQFAKVYAEYNGPDDTPSINYIEWAQKGWQNPKPTVYPLGAWNKALYHWWDGKKLNHFEAQRQIFLPLYKKAVTKTTAFARLKEIYDTATKDIVLLDYEGYNYKALDMTLDDVYKNENFPIGQGFALCMILEGYLK